MSEFSLSIKEKLEFFVQKIFSPVISPENVVFDYEFKGSEWRVNLQIDFVKVEAELQAEIAKEYEAQAENQAEKKSKKQAKTTAHLDKNLEEIEETEEKQDDLDEFFEEEISLRDLLDSEFLFSLQKLIRSLIQKQFPGDRTHFSLDLNHQRQNREGQIEAKIPAILHKLIVKEGKNLILVGFNNYERMLIHSICSDVAGVKSMSLGDPERRRLLIFSSSETGTSQIEDSLIFNMRQLQEFQE